MSATIHIPAFGFVEQFDEDKKALHKADRIRNELGHEVLVCFTNSAREANTAERPQPENSG